MSSNTEEVLCKFCKPLPMIGSKFESFHNIPYYKTFEDVKASSLNGCILCTWILENNPHEISKIGRLAYNVSSEHQTFQLEYFITEDQKQIILEKLRQTHRQTRRQFIIEGSGSSSRTSMFFGTFYRNGRASPSALLQR
jgi:hypothetical protein